MKDHALTNLQLPRHITLRDDSDVNVTYELSAAKQADSLRMSVHLGLAFFAAQKSLSERQKQEIEFDTVLELSELPDLSRSNPRWKAVRQELRRSGNFIDAYLYVAMSAFLKLHKVEVSIYDNYLQFVIMHGHKPIEARLSMIEASTFFNIDFDKIDTEARAAADELVDS